MYNKKHRNDARGIHDSQNTISRRKLLKTAGGAALAATMGLNEGTVAAIGETRTSMPLKGNIKHSVCQWCYENISLEELAENSARIGIKSIELDVYPRDWPVLKKNGLICAMIGNPSIEKGLNRIENHDYCLNGIREGIEAASEAGFPNVICFSGNREGMPDDEGLENCAIGLEQVVGLAEEKGVTICIELLNSKLEHKDYMCDHTDWGVQLCKRVASPRLKLLYDIYHMQIMEGDIIRTIRDNIEYIGHIHTGGVPGRNEIDDTQELNYAAIMRAIAETNFDGYVAQEFIPKRDPIKSLEQAIQICDV